MRNDWDSGNAYAKYVAEAHRRGLSIRSCKQKLESTALETNSSEICPTANTAAPSGIDPAVDRAYVAGIQSALQQRGFFSGAVDGRRGPVTITAICAYQKKAGLPIDGLADRQLLDHIKFSQPQVYASQP